MTEYLNRKQIVEHAHGFKTAAVDVPEWGGKVLVRDMSVPEVTEIGMRVLATSGSISKKEVDELGAVDGLMSLKLDLAALSSLFPQIVAWCVVDEAMQSLFTLKDIHTMNSRSTEPVQRIAQKALILSGLFQPGTGEDAEEEAEPEADPTPESETT